MLALIERSVIESCKGSCFGNSSLGLNLPICLWNQLNECVWCLSVCVANHLDFLHTEDTNHNKDRVVYYESVHRDIVSSFLF